MARAALHLAAVSPRVSANIVAAESFPELADRYGIRSVPTTIVDETGAIVGAPPELELVRRVILSSTG